MFADSSTRSGADSTGARRQRNAIAELAFEQLRQRVRVADMRGLGEVPRHELDVARAAADRRHPVGGQRRASGLAGVGLERGRVDRRAGKRRPQRRVRVQADEQIGLAVVGDRRALVDRHAAVVVSREQHPDAEPRFDRRFDSPGDGEREVFLLGPAGAFRAFVVSAVARIDGDRSNRRRRRGERGQVRRRSGGDRRRGRRGIARRPPRSRR